MNIQCNSGAVIYPFHTPVVIPFYKAKEKLGRCLAALDDQELNYNGEEFATQSYVKDNSEQNDLYTKAVNVGLREFLKGESDYALVLTQDCYLSRDCLKELHRVADDNPRAGLIAPVQLSGDRVTFAGAKDAFPVGQHVVYSQSELKKLRPHKINWANGACFLVRMQAAREVGLLDENFRHVCSDSDYSFTMRSRGWDVMLAPRALCEHQLDSSGGNAPDWLRQVMAEDQKYFYRKWLSGELFQELSKEVI